mmetsp:Transcript_4699/g.11688  ORF Transcript_4699/g.11688 Transcript_4699/m.11688 type:complete len:322 (-) Transcript_4699:2958-3923(-)
MVLSVWSKCRRFFKPYYVLNSLLLLSYALVRHLVPRYRPLWLPSLTATMSQEGTVFTCLVLFLLMKFPKSPTMEHWLGKVFLFGDIAILALTAAINWKVMVWYLAGIAALTIAFPQPSYDGPENVTFMRDATFRDHVLRPLLLKEKREAAKAAGKSGADSNGVSSSANTKQSQKGKNKNKNNNKKKNGNNKNKTPPQRWLVEFFTTWSPPCKTLAPLFAELSLEYGTERFRFGKVNVDVCPKLAERYRISREATSSQLPTLILFEDGEEKARLPPLSGRAVPLTRRNLERLFELEFLSSDSRESASISSQPSDGRTDGLSD